MHLYVPDPLNPTQDLLGSGGNEGSANFVADTTGNFKFCVYNPYASATITVTVTVVSYYSLLLRQVLVADLIRARRRFELLVFVVWSIWTSVMRYSSLLSILEQALRTVISFRPDALSRLSAPAMDDTMSLRGDQSYNSEVNASFQPVDRLIRCDLYAGRAPFCLCIKNPTL